VGGDDVDEENAVYGVNAADPLLVPTNGIVVVVVVVVVVRIDNLNPIHRNARCGSCFDCDAEVCWW
jgi:hypothetical protein